MALQLFALILPTRAVQLESIENDQVDTPFIYCPKHPLVDDRGNCLDSPVRLPPSSVLDRAHDRPASCML
jgi:flagellar basal body rod protein FlgC